MNHPTFLPRALRLFLLGVFLSTSTFLEAQTARPGGSARTSSAGTRSTTGRTNSSSGSRSGSGQRTYRSNTELGDAMITIDPETRSLVIVTDEETHNEMLNVIKTLDRPKPQVLIKVVFVEITYNKDSDIGLEGSYAFNLEGGKTATTGTKTTTTTTPGTTSSGGTTNTVETITQAIGSAASLGRAIASGSNFGLATETAGLVVKAVGDDWSATLHALSSKGKVEVLSRPSIMARNNQEAVIVIGSEVPFITNSRTDNNGNLLNTITYDNVGIILRVTPFITSEGTIEMIVAPEISKINRAVTVPIGNNQNAVTIDKRSAETVVVTPNGKSIVIGGLMETQREDRVQKVPLLGDIPILGIPFRRTIKSDQKRELMIFLTPTIVNNPASIDRVNAAELDRSELSHRTSAEADLGRFTDDLPPLPEAEPVLEAPEVRRATALNPAARVQSPKPKAKAAAPPQSPATPAPPIRNSPPPIRGKATPF